ncbi:hypothetical protein [Streptomyces sp. NPDC059262]|uniref:hypothetical protein n=1 Tax=Streptomyces sp. NPDC059262 TaxID=3346797 RepID=UPI00368570B3
MTRSMVVREVRLVTGLEHGAEAMAGTGDPHGNTHAPTVLVGEKAAQLMGAAR